MKAPAKSKTKIRDDSLPFGALGDSSATRLTIAERRALGKALRAQVPRRSHATFTPAPSPPIQWPFSKSRARRGSPFSSPFATHARSPRPSRSCAARPP